MQRANKLMAAGNCPLMRKYLIFLSPSGDLRIRNWEIVSGSFLIPFESGLEVPSQYASNFSFLPWYNS